MKKSKKTLLPLFYKKKPRRPLSKKQKKLLKFTLQKFLFKKEKIHNSKKNFSDSLYVEGHYESEKYFKDFANDLKVKFTINENYIDKNNNFWNRH